MSVAAAVSEVPEAKKLRLSLSSKVEKSDYSCRQTSPIGDAGVESPAGSSSARSSTPVFKIKEEEIEGDERAPPENGQILVDVLSTAMMFQANALFKSNLALIHQQQQQQQQQQQEIVQSQSISHYQRGRGSKSSTPTANGPAIPGALAVAASPAAALFSDDDWSWHRNPAAAIRSGGTNKQTPVWKYFVYNKLENLSRCIVGDCTYMLKGPHTSTLACHLKKHPKEYAEFQKLKIEYTRDRNGGQLPPSPDSTGSASTTGSCRSKANNHNNSNNYTIKTSRLNESSVGALNLTKHSNSANNKTHTASNIYNAFKTRTNTATNANLLHNSMCTLLGNEATSGTSPSAHNAALNLIFKNNAFPTESSSVLAKDLKNYASTGRKWGRDDRRQKEVETKLALMLSATQLPTTMVENSYFREFLEFLQPKFTIPSEVNHVEDIINTQHARALLNLRNQISVARKMAVMVDVLRLSAPSTSLPISNGEESTEARENPTNSGAKTDSTKDETQVDDHIKSEDIPFIRLCVSVAFYNPLSQRMEVALLGVRPFLESANTITSVQTTVQQVLSEFDIPQEKISRCLTNGLYDLVNCNQKEIFPKSLEAYNQKLTQSLVEVIDVNVTINELKKSFYSMFLNFITYPGAVELLNQTVGRTVRLPIADSFLVLIDAVLEVKNAFMMVCSQISTSAIQTISDGEWQILEDVSRLLRLFRAHMNVLHGGHYATIDGVVPSLMQLQLSLKKDFSLLGDLAEQLRADLQKRSAFILDFTSDGFDGSFIQATALNPYLAILLDDDQVSYAKNTIEKQLSERMKNSEEAAARRNSVLNNGIDAILSSFVERNANSSPILNLGSNSSNEDGLFPIPSSSANLYPDLLQAANERRKTKERLQSDVKNRYAEAIVQSYFDETIADRSTSPSLFKISPFGHHLSPLQFWQLNSVKYGLLSEIAIELLTIPSSTVSLERIFATTAMDNDDSGAQFSFDTISLLKSIDDPIRMERDAMLRFNNSFIPRL